MPRSARLREQLMHELLKQLPSELRPRKHGGHSSALGVSVKEHFAEAADGEGDCVQCSHRPGHRVRSSFVCHIVACTYALVNALYCIIHNTLSVHT